MHFTNIKLFLATACLLSEAVVQTKLKIMPLGDSITEITCWRPMVWDNLTTAGLVNQVQFVGSMTDNTQNCVASDANWDHHHEGHSGFLAIDIANSDLTAWLASAKPDIVMFMLGTNDVFRGHTTTEILAAYTKMVTEMRVSNPNMKIIDDLVIPSSVISNTGIDSLNAAIPAWITASSTAASPIVQTDCNTGFPTSDLRDGVHPNLAGDATIASRITPALVKVIDSALNGTSNYSLRLCIIPLLETVTSTTS